MAMRKALLTTSFAASIVIANITAAKLTWFEFPVVGGVAVPAGFIAFGVAFLCSDLLVEFEGKQYAHAVINGVIVAQIIGFGLIWLTIQLPTAPFYQGQSAYASTLGSSAAIVASSLITLAVSQHIDVRLFAALKAKSDYRFIRNCLSTGVSQIIDTVVFITLAFAVIPAFQGTTVTGGMELISIIVGQYIAKLLVVVGDTPVFYVATWWYDE